MNKVNLKINDKETLWSIDDQGTIYRSDGSIMKPLSRTKSYPIYRSYNSDVPFIRLDRLMYENFLGGKYSDDVPVFHIDGNEWNCCINNLHVGFLPDSRYPNEIWKQHHARNLPNCINPDIVTSYWISTYGRCYSTVYYQFMKPHDGMYPIRIGTDEIFWTRIELMVADAFIPNPKNLPYVVRLIQNDDFSVRNVARSYYPDKLHTTKDTLPEDIFELYSEEFNVHNSNLWKNLLIDGFPSPYIISIYGRIYNTKTRHMLTPYIGSTGYYIVKVSCLGMPYDGKNVQLHRLIATTFIPNPNNYPVVNHIDGNKLNNSLDNLEWCTQQHNAQHAVDTGLYTPNYGDAHPGSKVKESDAELMIIKYLGGADPSSIAAEFGVPRTHVNRIVRGMRYKKLAEKYGLHGELLRRSQFIQEYKPKVLKLLEAGHTSTKEIINILGIEYKENRAFVKGVKKRYLLGMKIL